MKQMSLIEMDGFLKGKCIPSDLKINETNAEYLVRKFGELESKLETALRECRSAGITIDNLEAKCAALAAENAGLKDYLAPIGLKVEGTPATDTFLDEVRAQGVEMFAECAYTLEHHDHAVAFAAELRKGGNQ
ncbi:TPA: hypothetical protein ACM4JR_000197 [Escherichia coli]|uniref:hypothetical protein n=1 Tax=Escherichia coli TaxID=562 RepID=UPI00192C4FB5|nr:hypothetical protein [Escherichia coli]EJE8217269.1 hypothetical protein [Escherichia coli]EJE8391572.1 hypothetical protein [Escherichia coli]MBL6475404.1 hypothetical protein [Escherichia coli]MBL6493299.1 hypothetical protein [Escherichia coli]MBL6498035.1 hypothetical protein [Escherichia coli]